MSDEKTLATSVIRGRAYLLGDEINTDMHCSTKYHPGRDNAFAAQHAFERVSPGFPQRFTKGGIIVAGKNFGNNSSREQAVHILHAMGVAGIVSTAFGRQFYRNCINNGLPVVECELAGLTEGDEVEIDLAAGREVPALPPAVRAILAAGGLIPFLKAHPDWKAA